MDAYVSSGARPAACAGEASQEAEHGTQAGDLDDGEHATEEVDAIVSVSSGHNGYLLCTKNIPTDHMRNLVSMLEKKLEVVSCCPMVLTKADGSGAMPQV